MSRHAIAFLVLCLLLFAACQPTPEQDVVVNKRDAELEVIVASSPVPFENEQQHTEELDTIEKPDTTEENEELAGAGGRLQDIKGQLWQEDFTCNDLTIHVDTSFEAAGETCPVYEISTKKFDASFANSFLESVAGEMTEMTDVSLTLQEVEDALNSAMRGQLSEIDGRITYEPYEGQEEDIAYWGALYSEMKKSGDEYVWESVQSIDTIPHKKYYRNEDKDIFYYTVTDGYLGLSIGMGKKMITQPEELVKGGGAIMGEPAGTTIQVKGVTPEEAESIGRSTIEKMGTQQLNLAACQKARIVNGNNSKVEFTGYMLFFTLAWDDYLAADYKNVQGYTAFDEPEEEYSSPWLFEYAYVFVDENKEVRKLYWQYPLQKEALLNENVSILTLEETKSRILNQLRFLFATNGEGQVEVNRIFLSGLPIKRPGSANGMLVPTWIVEYTYNDDLAYHNQPFLLALNAIDGSIIDLTKGY